MIPEFKDEICVLMNSKCSFLSVLTWDNVCKTILEQLGSKTRVWGDFRRVS